MSYITLTIVPKYYTYSLHKIGNIKKIKEKACHPDISPVVTCCTDGSQQLVFMSLYSTLTLGLAMCDGYFYVNWLGYDALFFGKHKSRCCFEGIFREVINIYVIRLE